MKIVIRLILWSMLAANAQGQETEFYVVDVGPNRGPPWQVLKYDQNGQDPEVFISTELNRPQDIVFLEESNTALVSNLFSGRITRYHADSGVFIDDFANGIGQPTRMKIGTDGLLYVLQWQGNGKVLRYDLEGKLVDEFTSVGVTQSIGMDWDSQGNLYVASFDARQVRKFDSSGNDLGLFISAGLLGPTNIWFDSSGDLLVMDWSGGVVRRFDSNGAFKSNFIPGLSEPEGVEFLENGHILIGNGGTSSVREFDTDGILVGDFVPAGSGGLAKPNAVFFRKPRGFRMNAGLNDAWVNANAAFQGLFVTVFPVLDLVFVAWFTFDSQVPAGNSNAVFGAIDQRWVTGLGAIDNNRAELKMELTSGGVFNSSDPLPVQDTIYGSMILEFSDCSQGSVSYNFPTAGQAGEFTINRVANDNTALCESLINP